MESKTQRYLRKATEFSDKAEIAQDEHGRTAYRKLANGYRLLSGQFSVGADATDSEALARRIVERT